MLLHPAVMVLVVCSAAAAVLTTAAVAIGGAITVGWNVADSGAVQLTRERRRLLVEAVLKLVMTWQTVSVFLFVATADRLHQVLAGAMCAAGTLNANVYGYPALLAKLSSCILGGLWLILNRASDAVCDRGMVRARYLFLLLVWGVLVTENVLQLRFFAGLEPDVLTSCCGVVFDPQGRAAVAGVTSLPAALSRAVFIGLLLITLAAGLHAVLRRRLPTTFAVLSGLLGVVSAVAVVSWVAPGFYQLPTHHCPFCLLSANVGWVGYPLFAAWAVAVVAGLGAGLVSCARTLDRQRALSEGEERRMCVVSMLAYAAFAALALWPSVFGPYRIGAS